jgi:hypothetical protein
MHVRVTRSRPIRAGVTALVVAIAGMTIQIAAGVKYPTVPPGVLILAGTAVILAFVPWPGVRVLGVAAPLFILIGGFASTTGRTDLSHPAHLGPFFGTVIQFLGLAGAVLAGMAAVVEWRITRPRPLSS